MRQVGGSKREKNQSQSWSYTLKFIGYILGHRSIKKEKKKRALHNTSDGFPGGSRSVSLVQPYKNTFALDILPHGFKAERNTEFQMCSVSSWQFLSLERKWSLRLSEGASSLPAFWLSFWGWRFLKGSKWLQTWSNLKADSFKICFRCLVSKFFTSFDSFMHRP